MTANDQVRSEIARCIDEVSENIAKKAIKLTNMAERYAHSDHAFAKRINEVSEKTVEKAVRLANMIEQYVQSDPTFAEMFPQAIKSVEYLRNQLTVKIADDTRKKYERTRWSNTRLVEFVPVDDTSKVLYHAFSNTLKGAVEEFKKNYSFYDRKNVQYRYTDERYATPVYGRYGL